jgi:hypothetical protein
LAIIGISYAQSVGQEEMMKTIQIINPNSGFSLKLWLDKTTEVTYTPGEKIKIFFQVSRDCFVTLYNYDTEGSVKVIFPNQNSTSGLTKAGEVRTIDGIIETSAQPGIEYIQGFATTKSTHTVLLPKANKDYKMFIQQFKSIIQPLPRTEWATSNLLSYVITPIITPQSYGSISVNSNPKGAEIYLDDIFEGLTPLKLDNINSGHHGLRIVISGYQEMTSDISILPSQTTKVSADLMPLQSYGSISVNSNPQGAKIYLDNAYKGVTPLKLGNINSGHHGLKIVISGYQEWTSDISILSSQTTKVSADLMPLQSYGSISVSCDQSGAKIFLDGTYKKATSTNLVILEDVEDGYHELTVIKDNFRTWVEDIEVFFGEESSVDVTMTELF